MSVCSTSGRLFSVVKLPCCLHAYRPTVHSGRRAARLSREILFHQDFCTFVALCSQLSRKKKRKLAQTVARAQPKTVPIQGTELVLTVTLLLCQCLATHTSLFDIVLLLQFSLFFLPQGTLYAAEHTCYGTDAPPLSQESFSNRAPRSSNNDGPGPSGPSPLKVAWNRVLRQLSSLPLAIGELAVIAVLSAIGTVIEQNKSLSFYMRVLHSIPCLLTPEMVLYMVPACLPCSDAMIRIPTRKMSDMI